MIIGWHWIVYGLLLYSTNTLIDPMIEIFFYIPLFNDNGREVAHGL